MRAPLRGGSRAGWRRAEPVSAGATDAHEDALRAVHHDVVGDALRVEGYERARRRAQLVLCGVDTRHRSVAAEAAEVAGREGAHASERLVA